MPTFYHTLSFFQHDIGHLHVTLCRLVKEDVQTSHIPVILLTAKDSTRDKEEGYAAGADSYLSKPFSAGLLISRIDNLLDNRRRLARLIGSQQTEEPGQEETDALRKLSKLDRNFLEKVNRVIEENMSLERMDIAFIADKMCMSHSTLYRKVKALMNISVNELVRDAKMRHAATLLESGEYTVTEVSDMTGFSSVPYFRQRFKEKYGMSPSEFMKKNLNSAALQFNFLFKFLGNKILPRILPCQIFHLP